MRHGQRVVVAVAEVRHERSVLLGLDALEARDDRRLAGARDRVVEEGQERIDAREDRVILAEEAGPEPDAGQVGLALALDEQRAARVARAGVRRRRQAVGLEQVGANRGIEDAGVRIVGVEVGLGRRAEDLHLGAALDADALDLRDVRHQRLAAAPARDLALLVGARHRRAQQRDRIERQLAIQVQDRDVGIVEARVVIGVRRRGLDARPHRRLARLGDHRQRLDVRQVVVTEIDEASDPGSRRVGCSAPPSRRSATRSRCPCREPSRRRSG